MMNQSLAAGLTLILWILLASGLPSRANAAEPHRIEILPVLVANTDGSDGPDLAGPRPALTGTRSTWRDYFRTLVQYANTVYQPHGIVFTFEWRDFHPTPLQNTLLNWNVTVDPTVLANLSNYRDRNVKPPCDPYPNSFARNSFAANHPDKIVIFITHAFDLVFGESQNHWVKSGTANWSNWTDNFVVLSPYLTSDDVFIFAHEVGHYLHLNHTFTAMPESVEQAKSWIQSYVQDSDHHPDDGDLLFDGDFGWVMDTPPDPGHLIWQAVFGSSCSDEDTLSFSVDFVIDNQAIEHRYHLSPERENIMSYHFPRAWPSADCTSVGYYPHLSAEQGARVLVAVTNGNRRDLTIPVPWENSPPIVVAQGPDRLDILSVGVDRGMYHKYWGASGWSPADIMASFHPLFGRFSDSPSAVSWGPGRLDVFALGEDGAIWHKGWDGDAREAGQCHTEAFQSRCWWPHTTRWHSLGGVLTGSPAAVSWGTGRFDLFARSPSGAVWHKAWDDAVGWHPSVSEWVFLGGETASKPTAVSWGFGRFDIFGRGENGDVIHKAWDNAFGWAPPGTEWESLGGFIMGTPAAVSRGPGRLDVFARGVDGAVWHKGWDDALGWFPSQDGWARLGGDTTDDPAAVSWGPGRFDVFARSVNGDVIHKAWDDAFGWAPPDTAWESIGGQIVGSPSAASWGPDRLDIVARAPHGGIWHKAWSDGWYPSGADWEYLGYYPTGELVFPEGPGICPQVGDTHCTGLVVQGPEGNVPGVYTVTATGHDESGDPVLFKFAAERTDGFTLHVPRQASGTTTFELGVGSFLITADVDDRPYCPDRADDAARSTIVVVTHPTGGPLFRRADTNADGNVDISDAVSILSWLFSGGPAPGCRAATNVNGDGQVDLSDAVALLGFLFQGGLAPAGPFPGCGTGALPTDDEMGCDIPPKTCQ